MAPTRFLCGLIVAISACANPSPAEPSAVLTADACIVRLHGKGAMGADPVLDDGVAILSPSGNAPGWGGRQWLYATDADYQTARATVADTLQSARCRRVVIHGFSNGAALATMLYCRGETFEGRIVGVVIDDPVTDNSSRGCTPAPQVDAVLYWTGALADAAPPGTTCESIDWTCAGDTVIGIDVFADDLGLTIAPSPTAQHQWNLAAPEPRQWLYGDPPAE